MDRQYTLSEEEKETALQNAQYVEHLKNNQGFKVVLAYLREDAHEALHQLKTVDPTEPLKVMKLQNAVKMYEEMFNKVDYILNLGDAVRFEKENEL